MQPSRKEALEFRKANVMPNREVESAILVLLHDLIEGACQDVIAHDVMFCR